MRRLFFALQPTPELFQSLTECAAPWVARLRAQAVVPSNLHATLCFIGAVPREKIDALLAAAAQVRGARVALEFDAFEVWKKPRILCVTASRESPAANALAVALRDASVAAGFTPDAKPFRAHVTLARKTRAVEAEKISWPQKISPGFVVRCERFALMESQPGKHGSIYSALHEWPLYE